MIEILINMKNAPVKWLFYLSPKRFVCYMQKIEQMKVKLKIISKLFWSKNIILIRNM